MPWAPLLRGHSNLRTFVFWPRHLTVHGRPFGFLESWSTGMLRPNLHGPLSRNILSMPPSKASVTSAGYATVPYWRWREKTCDTRRVCRLLRNRRPEAMARRAMPQRDHLAIASYFERRAQRARLESERGRFLLVARKYRAMAKKASGRALNQVQDRAAAAE